MGGAGQTIKITRRPSRYLRWGVACALAMAALAFLFIFAFAGRAEDQQGTLAKLISSADDPAPKAIAVLEVPEMRAIILGDPELRQLAREGRYSEILRDPRLDTMLENDNLREVLKDLDL